MNSKNCSWSWKASLNFKYFKSKVMCYLPSSYVKNIFARKGGSWHKQDNHLYRSRTIVDGTVKVNGPKTYTLLDPLRSSKIAKFRSYRLSTFLIAGLPTFLVQRRPLQLYVTSDHYNSFKKFDWILFPLTPICYISGISRSVNLFFDLWLRHTLPITHDVTWIWN